MLRSIFLSFFLLVAYADAALQYSNVLVSDTGTDNTISEPNTSRNVATDAAGNIFILFHGPSGIRVAKSSDNGASFSASVLISATDSEAEIAISENNTLYVAWTEEGSIRLSRSTNGGSSFSSASIVGPSSAASVHIATYNDALYLLPLDASSFYYSNNQGLTFTNTPFTAAGTIFSDIIVDSTNGDIYIITETPFIRYYKSVNGGASFFAGVTPGGELKYTTAAPLFNTISKTFIVAGGDDVGSSPYVYDAYRVDAATGSSTKLTFGQNRDNRRGRSLASNSYGYIVDGYTNDGKIYYAVSNNFGNSFNTPVTVASPTVLAGNALELSLAINRANRDIIVTYENNGQIYANIYVNEIAEAPTFPSGGAVTPSDGNVTTSQEVIDIPLMQWPGKVALVALLMLSAYRIGRLQKRPL